MRGMTVSARGSAGKPGQNVARKAGLNPAILSVGEGMAERMLAYKTLWYGLELPPYAAAQHEPDLLAVRAPRYRVAIQPGRVPLHGAQVHRPPT